MQAFVWNFKLTSQDDYATPMSGIPIPYILVYLSIDGGNFVKLGGGYTWDVLATFQWYESELFTWDELDLAVMSWDEVEAFSWDELDLSTWNEIDGEISAEIGNGWYQVEVLFNEFSSIVLKALAPGCSQCDEKLYFNILPDEV